MLRFVARERNCLIAGIERGREEPVHRGGDYTGGPKCRVLGAACLVPCWVPRAWCRAGAACLVPCCVPSAQCRRADARCPALGTHKHKALSTTRGTTHGTMHLARSTRHS